MMQYIDTHFHLLELKKRGIDPEKLLEELHAAGFHGGMDIGVSEDDLALRLPLLERYPKIKRAAGIGPWGAQGEQPIEQIVKQFASHISGNRIDSIGEIGLDYHWNYGTVERQKDLFRQQVDLANNLELPIVIHTREADSDMISMLSAMTLPHSGIMHCFSSSWELAKKALDQGLYISFAGPITYKKNNHLCEMLKKVPIDRLLLETDSPYLSPEPYRGKVNTPFRMVEIYAKAAEIKQMEVQDIADAIKTNFARLFPTDDR